MNTDRDFQIAFLKWIKERSPSHQSFVDDLGALLDVSRDSAYRRMRGETLLTLNELRKLCLHYKASLDTFFQLSNDTVLFHKRTIGDNYSYLDFLKAVRDNVALVGTNNHFKLSYIAKDIPPFHYFQYPNLTCFKSYFWLRTILRSPEHVNIPYGLSAIGTDITAMSKEVWNQYRMVDSLEVWSDETVNITLRQLEYYVDSSIVKPKEAQVILDEVDEMLSHLKVQAETGMKSDRGIRQTSGQGRFELYFNEIEIGDNTVFFELGPVQMVMKTYNMLNILSTTDPSFCANIEKYIRNLLQKSVPISTSAEKERERFFFRMQSKLEELRRKVLGMS